ncbi:metalloprotease TldD [Niveispirillum sp. SYP-B3756]|uniref:metalloprotease TldD n=1 Tax=Niveispirillum sp. SYP-B3756 TaxID=2662178 RepID=UPI001FFEA5EC|nr:metalloprotease TldD [Niveispirillum sp. SYP-B3756]
MTAMDTPAQGHSLQCAEQRLLAPHDIDLTDIARTLGALQGPGIDLADLFLESVHSRTWRMEDGKVAAGSFRIDQGVGARAASGADVAFAHSADMHPGALADLATTVSGLRRSSCGSSIVPLTTTPPHHTVYPPDYVVKEGDAADWISLLDRVDQVGRGADPRVIRVDAFIRATDQVILVADIAGRLAADVRPTVQMMVEVVALANGRRARGSAGMGGRHALADLTPARVDETVRKAVQMALTNLEARPAPAGVMPVVLAPGYAGVLFHEAVGHGLEGDHHRKRLSVFDGRMGERIAAPGVTVIDDGSLPGKLGSLGIDDEGVPGERTLLIEDGILTGLMQDRLNAGLMNDKPTGNGRRQSYAHLPMPRMTNTFLAAGQHDPAEILASVRNGIYAPGFGGGQVDIVSGRFNFSTTEAWLIEDGKLTAPLEGATLIGVGHEALKQISMIGNDLALDNGIALCGKQGQSVDVGVGQPTIRIDSMLVGGRGG